MTLPTRHPFAIGEVLGGHLQLRGLLARGGMSFVYEADDTLLRRKVAVKIVDDPSLGASLLLHEARALSAMQHPGLPVVHSLGVERGWTYLVLERLFGVTLEQRIAGAALSIEEAVRPLAEIADVLAAVHGAGMAHRDLKPANVMMCPRDRVVLLDFGIMAPEVTAASVDCAGTPRYLAPEVILRRVAPGRAHHADTYALGVMAFEMLAGAPPYEHESVEEILEQHLVMPVPDIAARRPDVPVPLAAMITACLAKDPSDRPETMEVAWTLRGLLRRNRPPTGPRLRPLSVREI